MPWRRTRDPYAIWVSEIMLQQTRVDTVVPRYAGFLEEFPTVAALAESSEARVCEAWAGLGYYRRARNLYRAAQQLMRERGGELPRDVAGLRALPGVGRYTAGAIASIAFDVPAPIVDGNVARVLQRVFAIDGAPDDSSVQARLWALAAGLAEGEAPGELNQALMELGATLCAPRAPRCGECPIAASCAARRQGEPELYPGKKRRAAPRRLRMAFAYMAERGGVWLRQRPLAGLWAGLWELPSSEGESSAGALAQACGAEVGRELARVEHQLTHRSVTARIYAAAPPRPIPEGWKLSRRPLDEPLSTLARKAITAARQARR